MFKTWLKYFYILDGPNKAVISVDKNYTLIEGESTDSISCSAECFPKCSIYWESEKTSSVLMNILPNPANRSMNGKYICVASNIVTNETKTSEFNLNVYCKLDKLG